MTKYSLRARMMILILAPTLLIGLLLSTFFVVHRYNQLHDQLVDFGSSIIAPLTVASDISNRQALKQLVSVLHRRHSETVRSITVFDENNKLYVSSNYPRGVSILQLPPGEPLPTQLTFSRHDGSLILRAPIISTNLADFDLDTTEKTRHGYIAIELDLQNIRLEQYKEIFIFSLLLILCVGISVLFAYRLMRDVTGPISNMVDTVDNIRRGQLDSRVEGYMLGELNMLKNGINAMAMSLAAYHEEMQQNIDQATSDLRETLEQMEIQNVELDLAKKRAQEAARIKSEFLANMSHELRTPLNGVIGFTRQTLKTPLNATQLDYLQTIERSANNLLTIINDVLDFSKLEAGKLVLEHIPFSLYEMIDEVIVLLAPSAHEKGLELTLDVRSDVPELVIGDSLRLQQIITNLLGNAIKFTENGNVDVRVELRSHEGKKIELEVQIHDSGIGISERQQSQLFQAFRQADTSISRRHGGTGLGLVITQRLVKEMGGDIYFHSRLSRGSTFWFHVTLELNNTQPQPYDGIERLQGKRLAYIEANLTAAQATLNILSQTPLEVTHYVTLKQLQQTQQHVDIILAGVPINNPQDDDKVNAALALCDRLIMALPSPLQIYAEHIKQQGALGCLIKPITRNRLLALLCSQQPLLPEISVASSRLPLTVMAVDDNPANLKLIGALLEELVDKIVLCESGKEAVEQAKTTDLDIILMDIQMPQIDGIRAAELIHQLPNHRYTPIVAVTAHAISGERDHLLKSGMDDYLAKPIDEAMLMRVLSHYHRSTGTTLPVVTSSSMLETKQVPSVSLDWSLALQQSANKEDLACDLLKMLLDFLPQVTEHIEAITAGSDDSDILDLIHKLHGSCSYSGVPRLKHLCHYIEQQLRAGSSVSELEPEWFELLDEIENVTRAAKKHLQQH